MAYGEDTFGEAAYGEGADGGPASVAFTGVGTLTAYVAPTIAQVAFTGVGTLAAVGTVAVGGARVGFTGRGDLRASPTFVGTDWRVLVVEFDGTVLGQLENAVVGDVSYALNEPETWTVTLPGNDAKLPLVLAEKFRELQIWRGDRLLSWGPIVRPQVSLGPVVLRGAGAAWHLGRRSISRIPPTEYLANGGFEDGLAGWSMAYNEVQSAGDPVAYPPVGPQHAVVNVPALKGSRALRLEQDQPGRDTFAFQRFPWTVDAGSPYGDAFVLRGYVWLDGDFWVGPAAGGSGLHLERSSTTELDPDPVVQAILPGHLRSLQTEVAPIDDDTPRDTWVRLEVGLTLPPKAGEPEDVTVRLYAPGGAVTWDEVSLSRDEALALVATDQAQIVEQIVQVAQDPSLGKSDLNIATDCPPTGVLRNRRYRFAEHGGAWAAIREFTELSNGVDISMRYTPTQRTLCTHHPRRGARRPRALLALGRNLVDFVWTWDGERAATATVVLGEGDGPDREAGIAVDTSTFSRGLIVEDVATAPAETPIDSLDKLALEHLAVIREPEVLEVTTDTSLLGQVDVGDFVPVRIIRRATHSDGTASEVFAVDADYRIVALSVSPAEQLRMTLNRRSP